MSQEIQSYLGRDNADVDIITPAGQTTKGILVTMNNQERSAELHIKKFGENVDVDTVDATLATPQVVWPVKRSVQDFPFQIATLTTFTIQSTSANDDEGGTGAITVEYQYLDGNGAAQTDTVTLNGITGVTLNITSLCFCRMKVMTTGTSNTNEGDITVEKGGVIYAIIKTRQGQTQQAIYKIPTGYTGVVKNAVLKYGRGISPTNQADCRLVVKSGVDGTVNVKNNVILSTIHAYEKIEYRKNVLELNPGDFIYWDCISVSANDTSIVGEIDIDLVKAVS